MRAEDGRPLGHVLGGLGTEEPKRLVALEEDAEGLVLERLHRVARELQAPLETLLRRDHVVFLVGLERSRILRLGVVEISKLSVALRATVAAEPALLDVTALGEGAHLDDGCASGGGTSSYRGRRPWTGYGTTLCARV